MISLKMTSKREDINEWTGLTDDELWEAGFDLDDWDVCFESDVRLVGDIEEGWSEPKNDAWWLVRTMDNYCVGYKEVEYNGKWYYTVHHS